MKKSISTPMILIMVILVIILSGCKKKKPGIQEPTKEPTESTGDLVEESINKEEIMKDFSNIVEGKSGPDKVVAFIDEQIKKFTDIEGDKMISELEKILENSLESITDNILNLDTEEELMSIAGNELFFPEDKVQDIKNDKLREEIIKVLDSKYKLISVEGNYYPIVDYEKLKEYNKYISPELKDYISIKSMDSNAPMAIDAGLYISYDELSQRILKTEDFIQKYSGGQRHEEMLKAYRNKLTIYLSGMDNTPIVNSETKKINDVVLESYKKTANTKDKVTGFIVRKYVKIIEKNNYIIDEKTKENILSLINESLSLLEETK